MKLTAEQKNRIWDTMAERIGRESVPAVMFDLAIVRDRISQADIRPDGRTMIADLFPIPDPAATSALIALQNEGVLVLQRLDDPAEMTDADKRAAIDLGNGIKRHIIRFV